MPTSTYATISQGVPVDNSASKLSWRLVLGVCALMGLGALLLGETHSTSSFLAASSATRATQGLTRSSADSHRASAMNTRGLVNPSQNLAPGSTLPQTKTSRRAVPVAAAGSSVQVENFEGEAAYGAETRSTHNPMTIPFALMAWAAIGGFFALYKRSTQPQRVAMAAIEARDPEAPKEEAKEENPDANWVPVFAPEELPKGLRKEVVVDGLNLLVFWYRNEIYCIEARSPSEGAFSEGFMQSKFTQDFGIECPRTGTVFSLKDGSVLVWMPNNAVMRALTPKETCRKMEVYPVKLTQEALMIDIAGGSLGGVATVRTKGGADTSLENNNAFGLEPPVYLEGTDPSQRLVEATSDKPKIDPATAIVSLLAVAIISVAGTAWFAVNENLVGLGVFWAVGFGIVGSVGYNYVKEEE